MSETTELQEIADGIVLRLLDGPLRGGEFVLAAGVTLFVASSPAAVQCDAAPPDFPDNAFFIPVDGEGGNFEIEVTAEEGQPLRADIRDLRAFAEQAPYVFNTVRRVGSVAIAMRPQSQAWSDEVLSYSGDAPAARPSEASLQPTAPPPSDRKRIAGAFATAFLIGSMATMAVAAALWFVRDARLETKAQRAQLSQVAQLSNLLIGASGQYRILPGRDELVYILVANDRDAQWARQAVARSPHAAKTRVLLKSQELARVMGLITGRQEAPAYHVLRLNDPLKPVLLFSMERAALDADARQELARRLAAALPYADAVSVEALADAEVLRQAEEGLNRLGVRYRKVEHQGGATMSIHGELADGELQKIYTYVEGFYRQWGMQYIHFSVEMEDDRRKGKSFEYGGKGYVKSGASHWDFSV